MEHRVGDKNIIPSFCTHVGLELIVMGARSDLPGRRHAVPRPKREGRENSGRDFSGECVARGSTADFHFLMFPFISVFFVICCPGSFFCFCELFFSMFFEHVQLFLLERKKGKRGNGTYQIFNVLTFSSFLFF